MDYQIVWTEQATADLEAIATYIAENNPSAAQRTITAIVARVEQLQTVPLIGTIYPSGSMGRFRKIVSGNYRIFYRVAEEAKQVEILTIWHSSRADPDLTD
jgi:addiction module RelE/StbE family toxin